MVSGMAMKISRQVSPQPRQAKGLPIFSPAPISEMMTMNSVAFSMTTGVLIGWKA